MTNININATVNVDTVIVVVLGKFMKFKNIQLCDSKIEEFVNQLHNDKDFIEAITNMIKIAD